MVFLIGCDKETTEPNTVDPVEYLNSFGWHVEEKMSKAKLETKNLDPSTARFVDLKPYANDEIYITTYLLKEKQKTGEKIYAYIYQVNEEIIGGCGSLEGWLPGTFSLKDRKGLIARGHVSSITAS